MRSCDSRCLFSGSKGEVCAIEPLLAPPDLREHPITHYSLLAMASLTKVGALPTVTLLLLWPLTLDAEFVKRICSQQILVIGLKPTLKVWMTFPYSKVCM